jgi:NADH-quinone oxidoreductase subunit G
LLGGGGLAEALQALQEGEADTVIILENDLYRRAEREVVNAALEAAANVVAIDHLTNKTTARADVVLPASTFAEADGTLINSEGRAQRFYQVFVPSAGVQESWRWVRDIAVASGLPQVGAWQALDDVLATLAKTMPAFKPVLDAAPPAMVRIVGQKIPRQPLRFSGRTAIHANVDVNEPQPPEDPDSPLAFSMEGYERRPPAALIPRYWTPGWNSVQALNKFQSEVGGALVGGDPGQRLIEPAQDAETVYFHRIPPAFEPRIGEWLAVPIYHIFGSEELSILTPGIFERAPKAYVALNPKDAADLGIEENTEIELVPGDTTYLLPVRYEPSLPRGVVGLPVGLKGFESLALSTIQSRVRIRRVGSPEQEGKDK